MSIQIFLQVSCSCPVKEYFAKSKKFFYSEPRLYLALIQIKFVYPNISLRETTVTLSANPLDANVETHFNFFEVV